MKSVTGYLEDSFLALQSLQNQQCIKFKKKLNNGFTVEQAAIANTCSFRRNINLNPGIWWV
jgi:hypothetical protein